MLSLIEELKNNFEVKQLNTNEKSTCLETELFDTHDKAVKAVIQMLKDKGYKKITLPYLPVSYIVNDRDENFQGVINLCL